MIGLVRGRLALRAADHVLIDTGGPWGGVGYVVHVSDRTLAGLPPPGGDVALWTELLVREDLHQLVGFPTLAEREWHRLLTSVQGVGARLALAILGRLGPEGVARALATGDTGALRAAPGVGPKLAARIAVELRDKAPAVMAMGWAEAAPAALPAAPLPVPVPAAAPAPVAPAPAAHAAAAEALSALANLGYGPGEAAAAVAEAAAAGGDTPALIRAALRALAPKV